jgi:hypothetical protein
MTNLTRWESPCLHCYESLWVSLRLFVAEGVRCNLLGGNYCTSLWSNCAECIKYIHGEEKKNLECWRATYLTYYCYCLRKLLLKKRSTRRFWTRKWSKRRYFGRGLSSLFFEELAVEDKKSFKNFTKMSIRTFDDLLAKVGPKICRQNITFKECI